jgi:mono/diheme cytochrome c family protein
VIVKRTTFAIVVMLLIVTTLAIGQSGQEQSGQRVYDAQCRRCHGSEGRGTNKGPTLVPFKSTYEKVLQQVRHPECEMPSFSQSEVSDEEIAQIVAYLKIIK